MTHDEIKRFEDFLLEAFSEDMYARELRLCYKEKEYLERKYPKVRLKKMDTGQCSDDKHWFEVG